MTWLYQVLLAGGAQQQSSGGVITLTADAGNFSQTGQTAGILHRRRLEAGQGAVAFAGQAAGLRVSRRIAANGGSFALTGVHATLSGAVEHAGAARLGIGVSVAL